ncbi:hypothetical protein HaLaN_23489, partial [Haematococcus lacustris]
PFLLAPLSTEVVEAERASPHVRRCFAIVPQSGANQTAPCYALLRTRLARVVFKVGAACKGNLASLTMSGVNVTHLVKFEVHGPVAAMKSTSRSRSHQIGMGLEEAL